MKKLMVIAMAAAAMLSAGAVSPARTGSYAIGASAATYENESLASYARQVAAIVNKERAAQGLSPLKFSDELCGAANIRAAEIQQSFSHTRPNGTSCFTALTESGIRYRFAAENIAYGQRTPEQVMALWMNSSGHRANILSSRAEYIGIGVAYRNGTYYWTQFFASADGLTGSVVGDEAPAQTTLPTVTAPQETTTKPAVTTKPAATTTRRTTTTRPAATTTRRTTTASEKPETTAVQTTTAPKVTTAPASTTTAASSCNTARGCLDSIIRDRIAAILPEIGDNAAICEQLENIVCRLLMGIGCNK